MSRQCGRLGYQRLRSYPFHGLRQRLHEFRGVGLWLGFHFQRSGNEFA